MPRVISVVCVAVSESATFPEDSKVHASHWKLKHMELMGSAYTSIKAEMTDFHCVPGCTHFHKCRAGRGFSILASKHHRGEVCKVNHETR